MNLHWKDAERKVRALQINALVDCKELKWCNRSKHDWRNFNENYTEHLQMFIDLLAEFSAEKQIFTIADALIGGTSVVVSSGGTNFDSDLQGWGELDEEKVSVSE